MATTIEELQILITSETKDLRRELDRVRRELGSMERTAKKTTDGMKKAFKGVAAAVGAIVAGMGLKSAMDDAMKYEASLQQINRMMQTSAGEFKRWAESGAIAFGISKKEAVEYGAVFSNLIGTFSKGTKETMGLTTDILKASAVISGATGRDMEDVMFRIRSGLLGNTEAIEDLGVNVNVAMLESTEAFKKFANGKSWLQLSFQTQQQIRLFGILEQTTKKYGDTVAVNTASNLGTVIAVLKDVKLSLGQAFLPLLNVVIPILTQFAQALARVMSLVAQFSQGLFGKPSNVNATAQATANQAAAVGAVGDAYTEAGKAAKKAASSVAGFDEVNNLTSDTDSGAGEALTGSGIGSMAIPDLDMGSFAETTLEVSAKVEEMVTKVMAVLSAVNFQPLIDSFNNLKTAIEPFTEILFSGLRWFWDNILVPFGTWSVQSLIPAFLDLIAGALTVLNPLLTAFQPIAQYLWANFLQPIAIWTGGTVVSVLTSLGQAFTEIGNWMKEHQTTVTNITLALGSFFLAWKTVEMLAFIQMSGGVVAAYTRMTTAIWAATGAKIASAAQTVYLTALYAKDLVVSIGASVAALGRKTAAWVASTAAIAANKVALLANNVVLAGSFITNIASAATALVTNAARWVASTAAMVANKVAMVAGTIAQVAMTVATVAWNVAAAIGAGVTTAFGVAVQILISPITLVIAGIALLVTGIILLVKNWDTVKEVAADVWEGIKEVWSVASEWLKTNVISPIANLYIGLFNGIIDGVNWVIRALNKIKFDLPEWIPGIGGKSFGININEIMHIPKLAKGGITNGEMLATIGDNPGGREVVSPLNDLLGMVQSVVTTAILSASQMGGNQNQQLPDIVFQVDGQTLARVTNPYSARENTRIGGSMITAF